MIIPTLGNGALYQVWRNKAHYLTELERRKVFRITVAIFVLVGVVVMAWILRPAPPIPTYDNVWDHGTEGSSMRSGKPYIHDNKFVTPK